MFDGDFMLRLADISDAEQIYRNMQTVYDFLDDKSLYVCDDIEYVRKMILGGGFAVVTCDHCNNIVGNFVFRYPGDSFDNLGRDIGLCDSDLLEVVHMESVAVLPAYRGYGLQQKMLSYAENIIDKTKYRYFLATVSPDNLASCRSFEKNGYVVVVTKRKYNDYLRHIYLKKI